MKALQPAHPLVSWIILVYYSATQAALGSQVLIFPDKACGFCSGTGRASAETWKHTTLYLSEKSCSASSWCLAPRCWPGRWARGAPPPALGSPGPPDPPAAAAAAHSRQPWHPMCHHCPGLSSSHFSSVQGQSKFESIAKLIINKSEWVSEWVEERRGAWNESEGAHPRLRLSTSSRPRRWELLLLFVVQVPYFLFCSSLVLLVDPPRTLTLSLFHLHTHYSQTYTGPHTAHTVILWLDGTLHWFVPL